MEMTQAIYLTMSFYRADVIDEDNLNTPRVIDKNDMNRRDVIDKNNLNRIDLRDNLNGPDVIDEDDLNITWQNWHVAGSHAMFLIYCYNFLYPDALKFRLKQRE